MHKDNQNQAEEYGRQKFELEKSIRAQLERSSESPSRNSSKEKQDSSIAPEKVESETAD